MSCSFSVSTVWTYLATELTTSCERNFERLLKTLKALKVLTDTHPSNTFLVFRSLYARHGVSRAYHQKKSTKFEPSSAYSAKDCFGYHSFSIYVGSACFSWCRSSVGNKCSRDTGLVLLKVSNAIFCVTGQGGRQRYRK